MAERIVGLDIGTSALRAVELVIDGDAKPVLQAFGQVGLPPGSVVGGEIQDKSQVTEGIRRLWREGGFKDHRVHVGIAGLRAITREMELPQLPPDELQDAVRLQADEIIPFPIDRAEISSSVIARTTDAEGLPLLRVLVAAAHRDVVDQVVAAVEDAGLEPVHIDLETAALSRAFATTASEDVTEAVVSIGAGLTMVVIHRGGSLQFVRTIDLGGDTVTRAVASALDLPLVDADRVKRDLSQPGPHDEVAFAAVRRVVDELVAEVHNSIRYYASLPGREAPARVLLTGGAVKTVGLLTRLQAGLEVPVQVAMPLSLVDTTALGINDDEADTINPTVAVPIGLALDGPARTKFDLLPKAFAARRTERQVRRLLLMVGVLLLVLLGAGTAWRLLSVNSAENDIASLTSLATTITHTEIPKYDKAVRLSDETNAKEQSLQPLLSHEVDWLVVFNQLGQYLPNTDVMAGISLTASGGPGTTSARRSAVPTTPNVIGNGSTRVTTPDLTGVTIFGQAMANAPGLATVVFTGTLSGGTTTVTFPVNFKILTGAHGQRTGLFDVKIPTALISVKTSGKKTSGKKKS